MKIRWKPLLIQFAISLGVAGLSALSTMNSMGLYQSLNRPPLSPSRLAVRRCLDDPFCPNGSFCIPGLDH